uniref:p2C75 n=1 Tax=Arundo donax TaxID=35708 RepID=A0A0A9D4H2_ARUDO
MVLITTESISFLGKPILILHRLPSYMCSFATPFMPLVFSHFYSILFFFHVKCTKCFFSHPAK